MKGQPCRPLLLLPRKHLSNKIIFFFPPFFPHCPPCPPHGLAQGLGGCVGEDGSHHPQFSFVFTYPSKIGGLISDMRNRRQPAVSTISGGWMGDCRDHHLDGPNPAPCFGSFLMEAPPSLSRPYVWFFFFHNVKGWVGNNSLAPHSWSKHGKYASIHSVAV